MSEIMSNKLYDKNLREILKGGVISFVIKTMGVMSGYVFTLLITRKYGAQVMGIFTLVVTILNVFVVIGRLGLDTALLKFIAEFASQNKSDSIKETYMHALRLIIPSSILISLILYLLSPYIAEYVFNKPYLQPYFKMISFAILPMVVIYINSESLRALKEIKYYAFLQDLAISLFASIILAVSLLFLPGVHAPFIAYITSVIGVSILSVLIWLRKSKIISVTYTKSIQLKSLLDVSLPMLVTGSLILVIWWTDKIMLGIFRSDAELGIYNVAVKVSSLITICLMAINSIAAPKIAELYSTGDIEGLKRIAQQSTKLMFWSSFPFLIIFFLFPSFILGFFGEEFKAGTLALLFLSLGQFINTISGPVAYILLMTGKQKTFRNIMLIAVFANIPLNLMLIPAYGMNGAAFVSMLSLGMINLLPLAAIKYYYGFYTFSFRIIFNFRKQS